MAMAKFYYVHAQDFAGGDRERFYKCRIWCKASHYRNIGNIGSTRGKPYLVIANRSSTLHLSLYIPASLHHSLMYLL